MEYKKTKEVLNQMVADLSQMSMVIHQAHWYMRGPGFLNLHPLMDTYMAEIDGQLDEVSERLITLDGAPYSTLKEMTDNTKIKDKKGNYELTIEEHLENLVENYRYLADLYQKGIDIAGEEEDSVSEDLCVGFKTAIEKRIWMVQAQLGKAPEIDK